jgi:hypothetical protein
MEGRIDRGTVLLGLATALLVVGLSVTAGGAAAARARQKMARVEPIAR